MNTILIADNDARMRRMVKQTVASLASTAYEASDGGEAVAIYEAQRPDWVVMDLRMKPVDGLHATAQIKARFPEACILIFSQYADTELRAEAARVGAWDYVLKENLQQLPDILAGRCPRSNSGEVISKARDPLSRPPGRYEYQPLPVVMDRPLERKNLMETNRTSSQGSSPTMPGAAPGSGTPEPDARATTMAGVPQVRKLKDSAVRPAPGNSKAPIFQSAAMKAVVRTVERVAPSEVSVLITGESGTGKEVVADLLHSLSRRNKGPFIKINCAALPRELIESELFGSVKGAYTGAQSDRDGLFRQAEGGTLLLDELSEMPIETQSKLLRVLQDKEYRPVGGRTCLKADCRVIAATNRPVEVALREGKLREDLYYRISTISITLSPLRDRRDDILPLAYAFLRRYASEAGQPIDGFTPAAAALLQKHDWPGNVRQLQNEVQRGLLMCEGTQVDVQDLSIVPACKSEVDAALTLMESTERNMILQMLVETKGNKGEAAKRLGVARQTLYNKLKAYGIDG